MALILVQCATSVLPVVLSGIIICYIFQKFGANRGMPGDILADDKYKQIRVFILQNVCCFFFLPPLGSVMLLENRILVFAITLKVAVIMQVKNLQLSFC